MAHNTEVNTNSHKPDLAHLIRSVQRLEGNPDCFGSSWETCNQPDCPWREYCQEEAKRAIANKPNIPAK